jgi:hypothetical protein
MNGPQYKDVIQEAARTCLAYDLRGESSSYGVMQSRPSASAVGLLFGKQSAASMSSLNGRLVLPPLRIPSSPLSVLPALESGNARQVYSDTKDRNRHRIEEVPLGVITSVVYTSSLRPAQPSKSAELQQTDDYHEDLGHRQCNEIDNITLAPSSSVGFASSLQVCHL